MVDLINPVIFLDIDGVLNSVDWMIDLDSRGLSFNHPENQMDPAMVARLNRITDATNASIVISSTWRLPFLRNLENPVEVMQRCLKAYQITAPVIGITTYAFGVTGNRRGAEIQLWLDDHPEVTKFVILDDDSDMGNLMPKLIKTNGQTGLLDDHVKQIISIFSAPII